MRVYSIIITLCCLLSNYYLQAQAPSLSCIEQLNATLGSDCTLVLDPTLLSEQNGVPVIVQVKDEEGNLIDTVRIQHINRDLTYEAIDTSTGAMCWGRLLVELKRTPRTTTDSDTIMCGLDYGSLDLISIEEITEGLSDRCIANVTNIREEITTTGERCDTLETIRAITGSVNLEGLPRRITLHIDTIYELPLTIDMIECPRGDDENTIYFACQDIDGPPTPAEVEMMLGDTSAYPHVDKGVRMDTTITMRDSVIVVDTIAELILVNDIWTSIDVLVKDTIQLSDTSVATRRIILPLIPGETCNMSVVYRDDLFEGCNGPNQKVRRTWSILDWCTGEQKECLQWIIIDDREGPVITPLPDTTISIDPWKCFVAMPLRADVTEICGDFDLTWRTQFGNIIGDSIVTGIEIIDGPTEIYLRAEDACGNVSRDTFVITPIDAIAPIVQTEDTIYVTLTGLDIEGGATVPVDAIDAGSSDVGCGEVTRCVLLKEELDNPIIDPTTGMQRTDENGNPIYHAVQCKTDGVLEIIDTNGKDTTITEIPFVICKEEVKFCCTDLGDNEVALLVEDMSDNANRSIGWTIVRVEDKLVPQIECPAPITVTCADEDIVIPRPTVLGAVCAEEALEYVAVREVNTCGVGLITVVWTLEGEEVCRSQINVVPDDAFDPNTIRWPQHYNDREVAGVRRECEVIAEDSEGNDIYAIVETEEPVSMGFSLECGGDVNVEPIWCEGPCGNVLASFEDKVVESSESCKQIIRSWVVIDWCTWTPNSVDGEDASDTFEAVNDEWINDNSPCPDCHKQSSEKIYFRYTNVDVDGYYDFRQIIRISDDVNPEIAVVDSVNVEIFEGADRKDAPIGCEQSEFVTATASDVCGALILDPATIRWSIEVYDLDGNLIAGPKRVTGEEAIMTTGLGAPGDIHKIIWRATDDCGNRTTRETIVTFTDVKKPVAVCIERISTATMNVENGQALIWAADYDLGSFDNCTEVEVYFKDSLGNAVPSLMFDCSDLANGVTAMFDVQMFVADENGNESFCHAQLRVDDNADVCTDVDVVQASIAGAIRTEQGVMIEDARVEVVGTGRTNVTTVDGSYAFQQLITEETYELRSERNDAPLNGVSTLDLVQMQQHILGIRLLDSPYRVIAADVNGDQRVSAVDLVQLRQLLLGRSLEFPSNQSWRFVDARQSFERPLTPWPFTEVITVDPLQSDRNDEDFIGIKIGDVSGNAIANSLVGPGGRSEQRVDLEIEQRLLLPGVHRIP
ncbi:MAG: dockerin type I domain-containing protein, partial [Bacteroidota bacterium]